MSLKEYKMCVSVRNLGEKREAEPRVSEGRESDALNAPSACFEFFYVTSRMFSSVNAVSYSPTIWQVAVYKKKNVQILLGSAFELDSEEQPRAGEIQAVILYFWVWCEGSSVTLKPPPPMDVHGCVNETVSCIYTSLGGRAVLLKPSTGQSQGTLFPEFIATCVEIVFSMFFFCVAFLLRTHTISHLWLENRDTTTATDDGTKLYLRIFACCVHMEMFRLIWLLFWPAKGIKPLMSPPCL